MHSGEKFRYWHPQAGSQVTYNFNNNNNNKNAITYTTHIPVVFPERNHNPVQYDVALMTRKPSVARPIGGPIGGPREHPLPTPLYEHPFPRPSPKERTLAPPPWRTKGRSPFRPPIEGPKDRPPLPLSPFPLVPRSLPPSTPRQLTERTRPMTLRSPLLLADGPPIAQRPDHM